MGHAGGATGGHALHWATNWRYGSAELFEAGAFRVYRDAAELHQSLDEIGIP